MIFLLFKHDKVSGIGIDRFVADIELRVDNCLTRYDVRLSAAVGVAGIRDYSVLVGNKISVWQEEV